MVSRQMIAAVRVQVTSGSK